MTINSSCKNCQARKFSALSSQMEKNWTQMSEIWNSCIRERKKSELFRISVFWTGKFSQAIHILPESNPSKIAFTQLLLSKNILGSKWPILTVRDTRNQCEKSGHMVILSQRIFLPECGTSRSYIWATILWALEVNTGSSPSQILWLPDHNAVRR